MITTLHDTQRRLQALSAGDWQATDAERRTLFWRRGRDQLHHIDAARQAGILNALPANIALLDSQGRIVCVNDAWRQFAVANGLQDPGQGVGRNYLEVCEQVTGTDATRSGQVAAGIRSVLTRAAASFSMEYPCDAPAQPRWFLLHVTPLADDESGGAVVMHLNITDRKQAEDALRESRETIDLTLAAAHVGAWEIDLVANTTTHSPRHDRIFGYEQVPAEWGLERFLAHVRKKDRERVSRIFHASVAARDEFVFECRIYRQDGAQRWVWVHGRVLANAHGEAVRVLGIIKDITERKDAEEAMQESEQRFSAAFEHAPIGVALVSPEGLWFRVNGALCEFLGYSETDLLARTFQSITHPEDLELDLTHVRRMLAGEISTYQMEKRYIHGDGHPVLAQLNVSLVRDDKGRARYFISQIQDIGERRRSERTVERTLQRLSEAQRVGNIGDWEYEPATQLISWSPQVFKIFGRDPDLGPPRDYEENAALYDAPSGVLLGQKLDRAIESGEVQDYDLMALRPDGEQIHVHVVALPIKDDRGEVCRVYGTVQDISELKRAEKQSLRLAERLAVTLNSFTDGLFTVDPDWRFTFLNDEAERLLERTREGLLGQDVWSEFPALAGSSFEREYRRAMKDQVTVTVEAFFEPLNGWFSVRAFPSDQGLAVYFRNVTESKQAADALRASAEEFRTLAEVMPQIVWVTRPDGGTVYLNQQWMDYTGLTLAESLEQGWNQAFHPHDQEQAAEAWQQAIATKQASSMTGRLRRADGVYRWWLVRAAPFQDASGNVLKWIGTCTDIDDLKLAKLEISRRNEELRESQIRINRLNRTYAVLSQLNALTARKPRRDDLFNEACRLAVEVGQFRFAWVGVVAKGEDTIEPVAHAGNVPDFFEVAPEAVFDYRPDGIGRAGKAVREMKPQISNDFRHGRQKLMNDELRARDINSFAVMPLIVAGEAVGIIALYAAETGFFDQAEMSLLQEIAGTISLTIELVDKQDRLAYLAEYDPLTGLANRTLFLERLAQHMHRATAGGHQLAVFLLDLARFKNINESLGRPAGDSLLRQVAQWLTRFGGNSGLLARVGPDHFVAVLPAVKPGGDLVRLLESSMEALANHPFVVDDAVLRIAIKVGVVCFPDDGVDAETLFMHAEAALRNAKANGDRYLFYSSSMSAQVAGKLTLENQLRRALDNDEFVLHYQPKVRSDTGEVTSAEALIRWNDPRTGLVLPGRFIPVLEETGLIQEVGRWALRKAIEDYLRWCHCGLAAVRVAVNVSALQLRHRGFVGELEQFLAIDARANSGLELEITESMIMGDMKHGIASLHAIRAMGVTLALDDFGTGFSSLSYLSRLPINTLKIDQSFISDMTAGREGLALVSTIITLARSLRHKVVAEGVETEEQSRLLRLLGCDEMQGHLFGRPVSCVDFENKYLTPVHG